MKKNKNPIYLIDILYDLDESTAKIFAALGVGLYEDLTERFEQTMTAPEKENEQ